MALMDEFKKERDSIKNAPLKKKLQYFWDYYRWYAFGVLFIIAAIFIFVRTAQKSTETILYSMFFNTNSEESFHDEMSQEFHDYANIEDEKQIALIDIGYLLSTDSSMPGVQAAHQKISIFTQTNQLDILGGPVDSMNACIYNTYLCDLRTVLTKEQLTKYEPYFLYADEAILTAKQEAAKRSEEYTFTYPDLAKPEAMEQPVPIALNVSACEKIRMIYPDSEDTIAVGVSVGTIHLEQALDFIDYLFEE